MKVFDKPALIACLTVGVGCFLLSAGQLYGVEDTSAVSEHAGQEHAGQERFIETWELERLSEDTFVKLDVDGDSLIQEASEWTGSPELFAVKDVNGDGAISKLEREQMEVNTGADGS